MGDFINKLQEKISDIQYILLASIIALLLQVIVQFFANLYEQYIGVTNTYFEGEYGVFMWINMILIGPIIESGLLAILIRVLKYKFHILEEKKGL